LPYYLTPKNKIRRVQRGVTVRGQWHLWIYICYWSIRLDGKQIAHANSANWRIERAVGLLDGQTLTRVSVNPGDASSVFEFDLGGELHTWPWSDDRENEQWHLFEPSGYVLTVRGDGRYCHSPGNTPPDQEQWHSLSGE